jgi:hypothetical protein
MHTVEVSGVKEPISASLMEIGDIGIVVQSGSNEFNEYLGHGIIRTYSGLASLTKPRSTWDSFSADWPNFKVRILPAGTKITITVGE